METNYKIYLNPAGIAKGYELATDEVVVNPDNKTTKGVLIRNAKTGIYMIQSAASVSSVPQNFARGRALNYYRRNAGFTQKEMAEKMGVLEQNYQQWEYGTRKPNGTNLLKLASLLDVDPQKLL